MNREATQNHLFSTSLPCSDHVQALGLSSKPEMIMEDIMSGALNASLRTENDKGQRFFLGVKSMVIYLRCSTLCWCEQWSTVLYCILFSLELNFPPIFKGVRLWWRVDSAINGSDSWIYWNSQLAYFAPPKWHWQQLETRETSTKQPSI